MDDIGRRALGEALLGLNERERTAIVLLYVQRRSFREVGRLLGCSARSVTRLRDSAVRRLSEALASDIEHVLSQSVERVGGTYISHGIPKPVPWAECSCGRQGVVLDAGLCDICAPIAAEAEAAAFLKRHRRHDFEPVAIRR